MTKLTKAYHALFEQGISPAEYERRYQAYLSLYFRLRERSANSFLGRISFEQRHKLHPLMNFVNAAKNVVMGLRPRVIADRHSKADRPIIYAATHIGKFDIEVLFEALPDHAYVLSGDYEHLQGSINELFLTANGILFFNEFVNEDRTEIKQRMIDTLHHGANLLYFPEGAWNLMPNLPVLPCYWGIIDVARESNAIIVPVAIEQYGKRFDVIMGENYDVNDYAATPEGKGEAIIDLRDAMATLKWEIWENHPAKHADIAEHEWEDYVADRYAEWNYPTTDYCDRLCYKPKGITKPEEAFAPLKQLQPCRENAFLYNKHLKG